MCFDFRKKSISCCIFNAHLIILISIIINTISRMLNTKLVNGFIFLNQDNTRLNLHFFLILLSPCFLLKLTDIFNKKTHNGVRCAPTALFHFVELFCFYNYTMTRTPLSRGFGKISKKFLLRYSANNCEHIYFCSETPYGKEI